MFSGPVALRGTASSADVDVQQEHPRGAMAAEKMGVPLSDQLVERSSWLICILASGFAAYLLWRFEVAFAHKSLVLVFGTLAFLTTVYLVYARWRPAPILSNLAGAIAIIFCSIVMAAIISLVGLRYQFPLIDDVLANVDRSVGIDLPPIILWFADHSLISDFLSAAYLSSFIQLTGLTVFLAIAKRFDKLWQLVFIFAFTIVASTTISAFWPAIGAFAHFGYSADILGRLPRDAGIYHLEHFEYFRNAPFPEVSLGKLQGVVTFPSFHCCLALMTIFATTGTTWLFGGALFLNTLVLLSTIPIGGHYAIDLPCGALLWLVAMMAEARLRRWSLTAPIALPVPEAASV
jgi:hypothetical protein